MFNESQITKMLLDFKEGRISEKDIIEMLPVKKEPLGNPKELHPKELLLAILNISSYLLGNRLPSDTSQYAGASKKELLKFLNKAGSCCPAVNKKKEDGSLLVDSFLDNLEKALQEDTNNL